MTHDNALRPLRPLLAFEGLAAAIKAEALGPRIGMVERHAAIAMKFNAPLPHFIDLVHVYPTRAEALKIGAQAFGRDVSKLSCCAE